VSERKFEVQITYEFLDETSPQVQYEIIVAEQLQKQSSPSEVFFTPLRRCSATRAMASSFLRFLDHTQRRTTVGRIPLDE